MVKSKGKGKEVVGYAKFGAYLHRDNGGKARIAAYTSVNQPLRVEAHDETTRIAERTYKIVEEENAKLDGSTFYTKDVWNEQSGTAGETLEDGVSLPGATPNEGIPGENLSPLQVLKNFVDNIAADNRLQWIAIVGIAVVLVAATLVITLVK